MSMTEREVYSHRLTLYDPPLYGSTSIHDLNSVSGNESPDSDPIKGNSLTTRIPETDNLLLTSRSLTQQA